MEKSVSFIVMLGVKETFDLKKLIDNMNLYTKKMIEDNDDILSWGISLDFIKPVKEQ